MSRPNTSRACNATARMPRVAGGVPICQVRSGWSAASSVTGAIPALDYPARRRRGRLSLLQSLAAVTSNALALWPQILQREASAHGLAVHGRGLLNELPSVAAVRVAHAVEMGPPGMQGWYADWPAVLEFAP